MPKVPDLNPVQADTRPDTGFRADASVDNPSLAALPGQQTQQFGAAMTGAGDAGLRIAADMQNQINQTQVDDALNKMRQSTLDLTYNPDTGYQNIKGNDALQREGGVSLADEYGQKLQEQTDKLTENLGNDAQRRLFALRANDIATSFKGNIESHTLQEFKNYSLSVQDGAVKLGQDDAKRNWTDPVKIDTNLKSVQAAVVNAGKLQGKSANQVLVEMKTATSMVHLGVIDAALQNNNPTYAHQYLQKYSDQMSADDILKVNGAINQTLTKQIAQHSVTQATQYFSDRIAPTNQDRLAGITAEMESGNKDYKPDGTPVVSPAGAKYTMQVMPDTAKNPGFGITPAKDDSPAEYNRVGQQYLQALLQKYGSPAQAWAAYNAGPGRLDDAMKKADADGAPQNWLAYMPKETQNYVKNGMDKLGAGVGARPFPTEQEFMARATSALGDNPSPMQLQATREAAAYQFQILDKSRKEEADHAFGDALRDVAAKGGDYNSLDYNLKARLLQLAPEKTDDVIKYARTIRDGENRTNMGAFNFAMEHPDKIAAMPQAEFDHFQVTNFSRTDQEKVEAIRSKELNGDTKEGMLNNKVFNEVVNNRLLHIVPKPNNKADMGAYNDHVGSIKQYLSEFVISQQKQEGKHFTQDEITHCIDRAITTDVKFQNTALWGFGWRQADTSQKMFAMGVKDISDSSMAKVMADFAKVNITSPTDDQKLRLYWMKKQKGEL